LSISQASPSRQLSWASHEWFDAQKMMGSSRTGVNTIYRRLLLNLTSYGSGPIVLRIGGNSSDHTHEPTPSVVEPFAEVAEATGARFIPGLNLGHGDPGLAARQATAYLAGMPRGSILGFELGNEPDLYFKNGLRSAAYRASDYTSDFDTWKQGIGPLLPSGIQLFGPAWAFSTTTRDNAQGFLAKESHDLKIFSQHYYATNPAAHPQDDFLLTAAAATDGPSKLAAVVAAAHTRGMEFRVDEPGLASEIGIHGISDSFSAALWAVDTMFEYANVGVDGINWEASSGNSDLPFHFQTSTVGGRTIYALDSLNPIYYGFVFFQAATGSKPRLMPVILNTRANLKCWSTVDGAGVIRLVILNKDESKSGTVAMSAMKFAHATAVRLLAPSYKSLAGATFAGQTLDHSSDGQFSGVKRVETLDGSDGNFMIDLPATSAVLLALMGTPWNSQDRAGCQESSTRLASQSYRRFALLVISVLQRRPCCHRL
jgi:hypothetical protein